MINCNSFFFFFNFTCSVLTWSSCSYIAVAITEIFSSDLCAHACVCSFSIRLFSSPNIYDSQTSLSSKFKWTDCSNLRKQPTISGKYYPLRLWQTCWNCRSVILINIPLFCLESMHQVLTSLPQKLSLEDPGHFPKVTWCNKDSKLEPGSNSRTHTLTVRLYCLQWLLTADLAFETFIFIDIMIGLNGYSPDPKLAKGWHFYNSSVICCDTTSSNTVISVFIDLTHLGLMFSSSKTHLGLRWKLGFHQVTIQFQHSINCQGPQAIRKYIPTRSYQLS